MKKKMTDAKHNLMAVCMAAAALIAASCNSNPGPDSISSHTALPSGTAGSNCGVCHSSTNDPALDPLVTNGAGAAGKHAVHVTQRGITCDRCHADYTRTQTHANGTFDTGDPAARLINFSISFTGGQWIDDTGPGTGRCSTSCHGPDTPEWYGGAWTMPAACTTCHASSFNTALDPVVTNGSGSSGKHVTHVTSRNLPCARCHLGYPADISHMNGQFDTGDPAVLLTRFDTVNPGGTWVQDTGPFTGSCSALACHAGDVLAWYGLAGWTLPACSACHSAVVGSRRQVFGAGGDFSLNASTRSHHISGVNDPTTGQCLVCHDVSAHMGGMVRLKHADTGAGIAYTSSANTETFCLSCHDALGANGNMSPFADGSTLGAVPYKAGVQISTQWNKTYGHRYKDNGLTCLGNGTPNTGCHLNGHGSGNLGILALNMTFPLPDRFVENAFQLCFDCHASYPATVSKEVVFGVQRGGNYDDPYGPYRSSGPVTLTFNNAANTITRNTGSFITDRFLIGNEVDTNATDPANRGTFLVADATASTLTVTTLAGGDPALVDITEAGKTVSTWSPFYYIPAIQTRFRDQCAAVLDQPYKDDNCWWWYPQNVNLHWFHIGMQAGRYRDAMASGINCTTCHSVHGTNSQWGMPHDELGYQHNPGIGTDEYGTMSSQDPYTANLFPMNCTFACHNGAWFGTTSNWFEPPNE